MNAEIKQKWVEALRGGKYQQGKHKLMTQTLHGPLFCCLGVLADVTRDDNCPGRTGTSMVLHSVLTPEMAKHVGFGATKTSPRVPVEVVVKHIDELKANTVARHYGEDKTVELWSLNDSYGIGFNQLADIIEEAL